jgi:RHS repeat-associated protein
VRQTVGATTVDLLTGLGIDEYLTRTTPTTAEHFLTDALGSTVALTDAGGAVRTEYTYAPFGVATMTGGSTNELGYAGREDDGTNLVYYRARYYDPTRQRFISEDPIGFNGGDPNLYAYVLNTPINYTDPSGEIAPIIAAGVACGAGAVGGIAVVLSGRKPTWNQLAAGAGIGCAGGLAVLGVWTVAEGAAASAAVWPVMPEAIDKLEALAGKFATTGDKILSAAAQSNARFVDVLAKNFGNINIFLPRPDGAAGFMRVTLDPTQSRVISAG